MRFFANAQNDIVGRFFVILKPKAEGSLLSMFFNNKKQKGMEILRFAQNDSIRRFCHPKENQEILRFAGCRMTMWIFGNSYHLFNF
jgi:hypothetical protein